MDMLLKRLSLKKAQAICSHLPALNFGCYFGCSFKRDLSKVFISFENSHGGSNSDSELRLPDKCDPFSLLLNNQLIKKRTNLKNGSGIAGANLLPVNEIQLQKTISEEIFQKWTYDKLLQKLSTVSSEQLVNILNQLHCTTQEEKHNDQSEDLLVKFDKECCRISSKWDRSTYLKVAWSFYQLNPHRYWHLNKKLTTDLAGEIQGMSPKELIIYLVVCKHFRSFPSRIDKDKLELCLYQAIEKLSIEDLGLACLAFFECNQAICNNELIISLIQRLISSPTSTDERTVGSMLKAFRKCSSDSRSSFVRKAIVSVQSRLYDRIDNWGPKVLMQLVAVGSNLLYFHHPTIHRVIEKFLISMQQARLKDVERLAMAIAISCHQSSQSETFWAKVENEFAKLERSDEISRFPSSFISLVNYFVIANRYPEKLLRIVFNPNALENAKRFVNRQPFYISTKRELLSIHCSLNLERPSYCGPKLSVEDAEIFEKLFRKPLPKPGQRNLCNHDVFLLQLMETIREVLVVNDNTSLTYLQPHFVAPDIVFRTGSPNHLHTSDTQFVLVGGSRNMYSQFEKEPMGPLRMKIRQLEVMGYRVIPIPWYDFLPLSQSARAALLKNEIEVALTKPKKITK